MSRIGNFGASVGRVFQGMKERVGGLTERLGTKLFGSKGRQVSQIMGGRSPAAGAEVMGRGEGAGIGERQVSDLGVGIAAGGGGVEGMKGRLDGVLSEFKGAKFQNAESAFNRQLGAEIGNFVIGEDGKVDLGKLDELEGKLDGLMEGGKSPRHKELVKAFVGRLRTDGEFRAKLEGIGVPKEGNPAGEIIKSTLGLPMSHQLTEADVRKAVVSTFVSDLRQGKAGSCFTTSTAIQIRRMNPHMMLGDMKALVEDGVFSRMHKGKKCDFAIVQNVKNRDMDRSVQLGGFAGYRSLDKMPGLQQALGALGIEGRAEQMAVLKRVGGRGNIVQRLLFGKKITVREILKEVVMEKVGLSERMILKREEMQALGQEIRKLQGEGGVSDARLNAMIDRYDALSKEVLKVGDRFANYDKAMRVGENRVYSASNNKLLRSWEYALAAPGQGSDEKTLQDKLFDKVVGSEVMKEMKGVFEKKFGAEAGDVKKLFQSRLKELFNERIGVRYEGGVNVLYDKTGQKDLSALKGVGLDEGLKEIVGGLAREAAFSLLEGDMSEAKFKVLEKNNEKLHRILELLGFSEGAYYALNGDSSKGNISLIDAKKKLIGRFRGMVEGFEDIKKNGKTITGRKVSKAEIRQLQDAIVFLGSFIQKDLMGLEAGGGVEIGWPLAFMPKEDRINAYKELLGKDNGDALMEVGDEMGRILERQELSGLKKGERSILDDGGWGFTIADVYFGAEKGLELKEIEAKNAEELMVRLVATMRGMVDSGLDLNQEGLLVPVRSLGNHAFSLMPGEGFFREAIESDMSPEDWVAMRLKGEGDTVVIADSNWERGGEQLFLAVKKGVGGKLRLVTLTETGVEKGGVDAMGTAMSLMDQKEWISDSPWTVITDPARYEAR